MRSTLITGLLVSMPSAVLLALAALAVLIGNLRRRLQRAAAHEPAGSAGRAPVRPRGITNSFAPASRAGRR